MASNIRAIARLRLLLAADAHLDKLRLCLRLYLRLAHRFGWLGSGPYEHASRMVAGVGRLLGGWLRQTRAAAKGDDA